MTDPVKKPLRCRLGFHQDDYIGKKDPNDFLGYVKCQRCGRETMDTWDSL